MTESPWSGCETFHYKSYHLIFLVVLKQQSFSDNSSNTYQTSNDPDCCHANPKQVHMQDKPFDRTIQTDRSWRLLITWDLFYWSFCPTKSAMYSREAWSGQLTKITRTQNPFLFYSHPWYCPPKLKRIQKYPSNNTEITQVNLPAL